MNEWMELYHKAVETDFAEYQAIFDFCKTRVSAEEGIPAIIGLDDLVDTSSPVYEMSDMDKKMHERMAIEALLFNYVKVRAGDVRRKYPTIAPSMSALAEKLFCVDEETGDFLTYRQTVARASEHE